MPSEDPLTQDSDSTSVETTTVADVLAVKQLLFDVIKDAYEKKGVHDKNLPWEIVEMIIDYAEFWAHTSVNAKWEDGGCLRARGSSDRENVFVIRSLPIGVLPEQIDSHTHLGIVDGFIKLPPNTTNYPEPTEAAKLQTDKLIQRWVKANSIKSIKKSCRKIVFTIWSHDQGWGGEAKDRGTFNGSYTWFDVGHERVEAYDSTSSSTPEKLIDLHRFYLPPDPKIPEEENKEPVTCILRTLSPTIKPNDSLNHPFLPTPAHIVRNRTAHEELQKHVITWSHTDNISPEDASATNTLNECGRGTSSGNGEFVRSLNTGDIVTVWARARFLGWQNSIEYCEMDVYWAV